MTDQGTGPMTGARVRAETRNGTAAHEGYMPGFGNDFETEALPGALPPTPWSRLGDWPAVLAAAAAVLVAMRRRLTTTGA